MIPKEEKKLKRGLQDISPLFVLEASLEAEVKAQNSDLEIISVSSPDCPSDSLFLNTYLASQLSAQEKNCLILSVQDSEEKIAIPNLFQSESFGDHLKRVSLSTGQFEEAFAGQSDLAEPGMGSLSGYLFLDFEYGLSSASNQAIALLDKWIFLLRPTLDSLTESYKLMKAASYLNRELEYFVIFEGQPQDPRAGVLFEKLSSLAAKNLGIQLYWLGYMNLTRQSQNFIANLSLNHLFLKSLGKIHSIEKIRLVEFIKGWNVQSLGVAE